MDTMAAFAIGEANRNRESMVFDWNKAARLIQEQKPLSASAGLRGDWEWTGGEIYRDGKAITNKYTYLKSTWATPELDMDGKIVDCYVMESETMWDESTKWPKSALDILHDVIRSGA